MGDTVIVSKGFTVWVASEDDWKKVAGFLRTNEYAAGIVTVKEDGTPETIATEETLNSLITSVRTGTFKLIAAYAGTGDLNETIEGKAVAINNDGANELTIEVNGISILVKAGEVIGPTILNFEPFSSISVTATDNFRLWIYE